MKIECLFIVREEAEGPELIAAWDEYSISENPKGWESECNDVLRALNGAYLRHRYVTVSISDPKLAEALSNAEIPGKLEP